MVLIFSDLQCLFNPNNYIMSFTASYLAFFELLMSLEKPRTDKQNRKLGILGTYDFLKILLILTS